MANIKKIVRSEEFKVRLSKEEKDLFYKFAESLGTTPSRLARNLIMGQAEATIENKIMLPFIKAYKNYLKITGQNEEIEEIEKGE